MRLSKVALCICGRGANVPDLQVDDVRIVPILALNRFVREPLGADLFFMLTWVATGQISQDMMDFLRNSPHIKSMRWDDIGPAKLEQLNEELKMSHAENRTWLPSLMMPGSTNVKLGHGKPYRALLTLVQWAHCFEDVLSIERSRGERYKHVAFTRLDLVWMAGHPPLSLLEGIAAARRSTSSVATVWGLDGEEYAGINDRYLLVERAGAEVVANIFAQFSGFRAFDALQRFVRDSGFFTPTGSPVGAERLLNHAMLFHNLEIRRMTAVAALAHSNEADAGGTYKYERLSAWIFARLWSAGGVWEASPPEPYLLGARCKGIARTCCSARSLLFGGHLPCWTPTNRRIYSLQRCCSPHFVDAVLRPAPATLEHWLGTSTALDAELELASGSTGEKSNVSMSKWECVPADPSRAAKWFRARESGKRSLLSYSAYQLMPAGSVQCYNVSRLLADLSEEKGWI